MKMKDTAFSGVHGSFSNSLPITPLWSTLDGFPLPTPWRFPLLVAVYMFFVNSFKKRHL